MYYVKAGKDKLYPENQAIVQKAKIWTLSTWNLSVLREENGWLLGITAPGADIGSRTESRGCKGEIESLFEMRVVDVKVR